MKEIFHLRKKDLNRDILKYLAPNFQENLVGINEIGKWEFLATEFKVYNNSSSLKFNFSPAVRAGYTNVVQIS